MTEGNDGDVMLLTDLEPGWLGAGDGRKLGIHFLCPCCKETRIGVYFKNPIGGGEPMPESKRTYVDKDGQKHVQPLWQRENEMFEDLTLKPSINASGSGHWHGHVTNGRIE